MTIRSTTTGGIEVAEAAPSHTVKNVRLDLLPRILKFVESIICILSNHAVLHGTHNGDEDVVLQHKPDTVSVSREGT